ncbi:MAG: hypothetical protein FWG78_01140 [Coriobacteriia bacterium]|nr:hypothetical protein [Coriobacteriia bacterium]
MSDQDFFFDDDNTSTAPAKDKAKVEKPKKAANANAAAAPAKSAAKPTKKAAPGDEEDGGIVISVAVVALVAIIALLVGVIGGIFIGRSLVPSVPAGHPTQQGGGTGGMGGMGGGGMAPELTDEQMQQGMPEGHPTIGDAEEEPESAEPAAE